MILFQTFRSFKIVFGEIDDSIGTAQEMKISIKDFLSKCDQMSKISTFFLSCFHNC